MNGYFDVENPDKVTTKGKVYEEYEYAGWVLVVILLKSDILTHVILIIIFQ